jgi:hypothetical protein
MQYVGVVLATVMSSAMLRAQNDTKKIASFLNLIWTQLNRHGMGNVGVWSESTVLSVFRSNFIGNVGGSQSRHRRDGNEENLCCFQDTYPVHQAHSKLLS